MEFYPLTFEIDPDTRSIQTQVSGKKMALQDLHVNIRGVMCAQYGEVKSFKAPEFTLELHEGGHRLSWLDEITQDLEVVLEAQGGGGQVTRANMYLHLPKVADAPVVARPALEMSPVEKTAALVAAGMAASDAIAYVGRKLGGGVIPELEKHFVKELTEG